MNVAIIIAGGSGHRMGQDIPKQFINVYDKPVLIYTLEGFQKHPMIDAIEGGRRLVDEASHTKARLPTRFAATVHVCRSLTRPSPMQPVVTTLTPRGGRRQNCQQKKRPTDTAMSNALVYVPDSLNGPPRECQMARSVFLTRRQFSFL